jgi:acylphosphatase
MEPNPNEVVRVHIWVKGRVQGVGFRAHVEYAARKISGITGWVRNVGFDTVETLAEGRRENIETFIVMVKEGPRVSRVDDVKIDWESPNGEYNEFGVKRSL